MSDHAHLRDNFAGWLCSATPDQLVILADGLANELARRQHPAYSLLIYAAAMLRAERLITEKPA